MADRFEKPRRQLGIEDYSVGWICALDVELSAAIKMLDEEHPDIPASKHERLNNVYTLGSIGNHNVVLACLPAGQMGTISAATKVTEMMCRFTAIRFLLMVGIGGGVPSNEADIRLGDVVVSQPGNGYGGVIQYDFGKTGENGKLTCTGFLNTPPQSLLDALAKFKSKRIKPEGGCNLKSQLEIGSDEVPDLLFEPNFNHLGGSNCDSCSKIGKLVERKSRRGKQIQVHFGTIASGNQVMKDESTRDMVSAKFGGVLVLRWRRQG